MDVESAAASDIMMDVHHADGALCKPLQACHRVLFAALSLKIHSVNSLNLTSCTHCLIVCSLNTTLRRWSTQIYFSCADDAGPDISKVPHALEDVSHRLTKFKKPPTQPLTKPQLRKRRALQLAQICNEQSEAGKT